MRRLTYPNVLIAAVLILAFSLPTGCSSTKGMELENILTLQAERGQKKKEKAAEQAKKKSEEEKKKNESKKKQNLEEIISKSTSDPPELAFLNLPDGFRRLVGVEPSASQLEQTLEKAFPKGTVIWRHPESDIAVMAWKNPLDQKRILSLSRDQFIEEVKKVGAEFDTFFQNTREAHASVQITEADSLTEMTIKSKYLESENWQTQIRYIFFYKPDYRLNFMVLGRDDDLEKINAGLEAGFESFRKRLSEFFAAVYPLAKSKSAAA